MLRVIVSFNGMVLLSVAKLQQELQLLVEQKVAYEKCLLDLEAECKTNDQLLNACKKLKAAKQQQ